MIFNPGLEVVKDKYVSSSIGRAAVSKTAGWGFESLLTCLHAEVPAFAELQSASRYSGTQACIMRDEE